MTKEELKKQIIENKFSETVRCFGDDQLRNVIREIYCDGVMEGYKLARMRLELIGGLPMTGGEYYFEKNMDKIRKLIKLCMLYDECEEDEKRGVEITLNCGSCFLVDACRLAICRV